MSTRDFTFILRWFIRLIAWSIPDFLRAGSSKGALRGAGAGALLGVFAGIGWLALYPNEDDVVVLLIPFAFFLAAIAAPVGPIVLKTVRPTIINSRRPYSPSAAGRPGGWTAEGVGGSGENGQRAKGQMANGEGERAGWNGGLHFSQQG